MLSNEIKNIKNNNNPTIHRNTFDVSLFAIENQKNFTKEKRRKITNKIKEMIFNLKFKRNQSQWPSLASLAVVVVAVAAVAAASIRSSTFVLPSK